jgi:hypothetical protein
MSLSNASISGLNIRLRRLLSCILFKRKEATMAGPSRSRPQVDDQLALAYDVANVNCHFSSDIEAEVEGLVAVDRELEDLREREEQQKDINGPWRGVLTRASYNLAWLQELSEIVERGKLEGVLK